MQVFRAEMMVGEDLRVASQGWVYGQHEGPAGVVFTRRWKNKKPCKGWRRGHLWGLREAEPRIQGEAPVMLPVPCGSGWGPLWPPPQPRRAPMLTWLAWPHSGKSHNWGQL